MNKYDFVVTHRNTKSNPIELTVEKVAVLNDDVTLDLLLTQMGVSDYNIGQAIEKLEGLPYRASEVLITGLHGNILIKQP